MRQRALSKAAGKWNHQYLMLRQGESRDILGQWMNSNAVHENKRRRATQVITCSFPCRKWLHKLYSHMSPFCELCRKEREASGQPTDNLPLETVAHIQSAGCKAQKQSVIQAHNSCCKFCPRSSPSHIGSVISVPRPPKPINCVVVFGWLSRSVCLSLSHLATPVTGPPRTPVVDIVY